MQWINYLLFFLTQKQQPSSWINFTKSLNANVKWCWLFVVESIYCSLTVSTQIFNFCSSMFRNSFCKKSWISGSNPSIFNRSMLCLKIFLQCCQSLWKYTGTSKVYIFISSAPPHLSIPSLKWVVCPINSTTQPIL